MEIEYNLQPKDIKAYFKNARTFSVKVKHRYSLIQYIIWPFGLYLIHFIFLVYQSAPVSFALVHPIFYTFIGTFIIGPLFLELILFLKYKRYTSKIERLKNRKIIFRTDGCEYSNQESLIFTNWSSIHRVVEDESHYFIYISDNKSVILPKDCLKEEELQDISKLLKDKVEPYVVYQTPPISNKLVKVGFVLISFFFGLLLFSNWLENSPYLAEQNVYDLFVGIESNDDPKELLDEDLKLKDSVTMSNIKQVGRKIHTLYESNQNQEKSRAFSNLIIRANELVIERDEITHVYSGESRFWQMGDITFKIMPDNYVDVHYSPNQRANASETQKVIEYLKIEVYMTINGDENLLFKDVEYNRANLDFTEGKDLSIFGLSERYQLNRNSFFTNANGESINLDDITGFYMQVQWQSEDTDKIQTDEIIYSR